MPTANGVTHDTTERRLAALDSLLHTMSGALDVREVFDRISQIAQQVLPHDMVALPLIADDRETVIVHAAYASAGSVSSFPRTTRLPDRHRHLLDPGWDYLIFDDLLQEPLERNEPTAQAGFRSVLRVAVYVHGQVAGVLEFGSLVANRYTAADGLIGRRIADHVALALSHQRLAEASRHAAALREREANLSMLDGLLATLTGVLDVREVFAQVSHIASRVLPHDVMALLLALPDSQEILVHAITGNTVRPPSRIPISASHELLTPGWDHLRYDDLQSDPVQRTRLPAQSGYRSMLRMAMRIRGELIGAVDFGSYQVGLYSPSDVLVARRITDHMALAISHQRLADEARRVAEAQATARTLEARVKSLSAELSAVTGYRRVIGQSAEWTKVLKQATQVASTETTVLLLGESGTGKEVAARFIHRASARSGGALIALNCAALPEPLLESELFGFERGAFTGAMQAKPGQIEQAAGGVLFLDEVSEMSLGAQAKFLRVLQEREFQRLGGTRTLKADIRVIAATNRDLREAIRRGTFREDLYYRLNVFEIHLPPLRARRDDILPLSDAFLEELSRSLSRPPAGLSREACDRLQSYDWPGNVRELRNTLERAAILCDGGLITLEHLTFPLPVAPAATAAAGPPSTEHRAAPVRPAVDPLDESTDLRALEKEMIQRALEDARYNKSQAAKLLGVTRKQLYVRLRQHGLE
jgi:two-component system response regulator AtoC